LNLQTASSRSGEAVLIHQVSIIHSIAIFTALCYSPSQINYVTTLNRLQLKLNTENYRDNMENYREKITNKLCVSLYCSVLKF